MESGYQLEAGRGAYAVQCEPPRGKVEEEIGQGQAYDEEVPGGGPSDQRGGSEYLPTTEGLTGK